jgi:hypothetical protein
MPSPVYEIDVRLRVRARDADAARERVGHWTERWLGLRDADRARQLGVGAYASLDSVEIRQIVEKEGNE